MPIYAVQRLSFRKQHALLSAHTHTHTNGPSLCLVVPWLNSTLLTGRWQFSAWLDCDSHVSDCTEDVCARHIPIPATAALMLSGVMSIPHQEPLEFSKSQGCEERGTFTCDRLSRSYILAALGKIQDQLKPTAFMAWCLLSLSYWKLYLTGLSHHFTPSLQVRYTAFTLNRLSLALSLATAVPTRLIFHQVELPPKKNGQNKILS